METIADFVALARRDARAACERGRRALARIVSGNAEPGETDARLGGVALDRPGGARMTLGLRPQGRRLELLARYEIFEATRTVDVVMVEPDSDEGLDAFVARGAGILARRMREDAALNEPYSPLAAELADWLEEKA